MHMIAAGFIWYDDIMKFEQFIKLSFKFLNKYDPYHSYNLLYFGFRCIKQDITLATLTEQRLYSKNKQLSMGKKMNIFIKHLCDRMKDISNTNRQLYISPPQNGTTWDIIIVTIFDIISNSLDINRDTKAWINNIIVQKNELARTCIEIIDTIKVIHQKSNDSRSQTLDTLVKNRHLIH